MSAALVSTLIMLWCTGTSFSAPVITPGSGFTDSTETPAVIGNPGDKGYDAKAIARWDVVPFQTFTDTFGIGLPAFHINGIEKVAFSADGGPWTDVTEMTHNPRTDVWEYWAELHAADFADGEIEVRAIAYPKSAGEPRYVGAITLHANSGGTLENTGTYVYVSPDGTDDAGSGSESMPYQSIEYAISRVAASGTIAGGATLYLKAGDYPGPDGNTATGKRWITMTPAPGVPRDSVRITTYCRPKTSHLHFKNVTLAPNSGTRTLFEGYGSEADYLWFDSCAAVGLGRDVHERPLTNSYTVYQTDCTQRDFANGSGGALMRNVHISTILSDAFQNQRFLINCSVDDIDRLSSSAHPDIYQVYSPGSDVDNVIFYNVRATNCQAQGFFITESATYSNAAFVNVLINASGYLSQYSIPSNHVLMWHVTMVPQNFIWRGDSSVYNSHRNMDVRNCVFTVQKTDNAIDYHDIEAVVDFSNNHYIVDEGWKIFTPGEDSTTGDAGFIDQTGGDFHPADTSVLVNRATDRLVPCDANNEPRGDTTAIGAFRWSGETVVETTVAVRMLPVLPAGRLQAPVYYDCNGVRLNGVPSKAGVYILFDGREFTKSVVIE